MTRTVRCPQCMYKWTTKTEKSFTTCPNCNARFNVENNRVIDVFLGYRLKDRHGLWLVVPTKLISLLDDQESVEFGSREKLRDYLLENIEEEVWEEV